MLLSLSKFDSMKQYITSTLIMVLMFSSEPLFSQDKKGLDCLADHASRQSISLSCDCVSMISDIEISYHAEILVQGNCYHMKGNGLEIYCDGSSLWVMDHEIKEAVIERVSEGNQAYADNPALMIAKADQFFKRSDVMSKDGQFLYVMSPDADSFVKEAEILVSENGTFIKGSFLTRDGQSYVVDVTSQKYSDLVDIKKFRPQTFGAEWIVTDLR